MSDSRTTRVIDVFLAEGTDHLYISKTSENVNTLDHSHSDCHVRLFHRVHLDSYVREGFFVSLAVRSDNDDVSWIRCISVNMPVTHQRCLSRKDLIGGMRSMLLMLYLLTHLRASHLSASKMRASSGRERRPIS